MPCSTRSRGSFAPRIRAREVSELSAQCALPIRGEDSADRALFPALATHPGALGLIDDAAVLTAVDGDDLVITTDAIVEGVHFLPDDPPDTIARKALRVNLSDLAAKGATPAGFVLTLALRELERPGWSRSLARSARTPRNSAARCSAAIRSRRRGR